MRWPGVGIGMLVAAALALPTLPAVGARPAGAAPAGSVAARDCLPDARVAQGGRGSAGTPGEDTLGGPEPIGGNVALDVAASARAATGSVTIPVAVTIVTAPGVPRVGTTQVDRQIAVLNEAFAGGQATAAAPTAFRFTLQSVRRTPNAAWSDLVKGSTAEREMKAALRTGGTRTLNLYLTSLADGLLGWATYPWGARTNLVQDGVVAEAGSVPGGARAPYDRGDTAVHEVGHWLGLYHTFNNGCTSPGDSVADTPAESVPAFGCPTGRNTCAAPGNDPVRNFMDYSEDACMNRFTAGQASRMASMWQAYRA